MEAPSIELSADWVSYYCPIILHAEDGKAA
jgi:hypothetical protein